MVEVQESDEVPLTFAELFRNLTIFPDNLISAFDAFLFTELESFEAGILQVSIDAFYRSRRVDHAGIEFINFSRQGFIFLL